MRSLPALAAGSIAALALGCSAAPSGTGDTADADGETTDVRPDADDALGADDAAAEGVDEDGGTGEDGDGGGPLPGRIWPNAESAASSDPWLVEHHAEVAELRPRVLALNFVNAKDNSRMRAQLEEAAAAFAEASRPHGWEDPWRAPVLRYDVAYAVDLRDDPPPAGWPYRNSTRYPREDPVMGSWGFDYEQLFSREFADLYGIADPDDPGRNLDLCELVDRGLVHEVWLFVDGDVPDAGAAELLTLRPYYDETRGRREVPMSRCAGNGCFDADDRIPDHCTRTLHISSFNHTRGPGCFLENFGHAVESSFGNPSLLPFLARRFRPFAGFDLDERHGLPFDSWYACPYDGSDCLAYPTAASVAYDVSGLTGTIDPYDPVCGNVHFPPNGRRHYDLAGPATVLTTCEGFARGEGPGGIDLARPFDRSRFRAYERLASDCMGPFLVWWLQNFPGPGGPARDEAGGPMLAWLPFMYY